MKRREFISNIGLSVAGTCAVCLGACSKSNAPGGGGGGGNVNFNLNLNSSLLNVGDSITQSGVIVVRLAANNDVSSFTAVQVACTHEGTSIGYNTGLGIFICPNHGSRFTTTGAVILGPASSNLKRYTITINGTTLTVTG
jgi:Rieske Fe-S protein